MTKSEHPRFAHPRPRFFTAYSFAVATGILFVMSWVGQFVFQLIEVRNNASEHGQPFEWLEFWPEFFSATLENWQSEFLQLMWQAVGLTLFYFWGSSQSREGSDRLEAKVDALLHERGIDTDEFEIAEDVHASRRRGHVAG